MSKSPVVQVRLDSERLAFLDGLPGTRSEAIRYCVDFTSGARTPRSKIEERVQREATESPVTGPVTTVPARGQTVIRQKFSPKRHAISCTCLQCKPT